ncbi:MULTISPECIES: DoxX family protein [unclassified Nitrobacter]|jgi:putative oxidoreductase|uniref:DoxX family protein n=1 Tax=unclassified Nitrobacter TaxID=2620411 RepID=UPI00092BCACD|nr:MULTISPECIES: DoxX family protein [unclassified Nitrobacter]MBN9146670.1 DoxX family protein [Nitrobacter sp.]OJV02545.1 MAG: DoxX family protein [Nitrobacter sp. 62-23]
MDQISKLQPIVLSLLRFMSGLLLMQHGTAKLLGFPALPMFADLRIGSMVGAAGVIELVGGALLVVGLFTRPAAFIASGMTAVAYFMVHEPKGFMPIVNGGELAALYCFVFFYLVFAGGGPISLDRIIHKKT